MRRSSRLVLSAAIVLISALGFVLLVAGDSGPERMDNQAAEEFLHTGRRMLESGDTTGILSLFSADCKVLGTTPEKLRPSVVTAIDEMNGRKLTTVFRGLSVKPDTNAAFLSFEIDIDEHQKGAQIHYFTSHVNLTLKRLETPRWMGLYRAREWKITQLDADPPFGITDL